MIRQCNSLDLCACYTDYTSAIAHIGERDASAFCQMIQCTLFKLAWFVFTFVLAFCQMIERIVSELMLQFCPLSIVLIRIIRQLG